MNAETFASLADARHDLHDFETGGLSKQKYLRDLAQFAGLDCDSMLDRRLTDLRATASWRALRVALPRCLACGSVRVTSFDRSAEGDHLGMPHVDCGGLLTVEVHAHAAGIPRGHSYSVDGERLPDSDPNQ